MTRRAGGERAGPLTLGEREWVAVCRKNYVAFVKHFWHELLPDSPLVWNWHLDLLCDEMQALARRALAGQPKEHDLVVNVPFGTSKSTVISVMFQGWVWATAPWARFLCGTHTDSLAHDLGARAKDLVETETYRRYFPDVVVRRDRSAKEDYVTTRGGGRKSCTVGGKTPMGRHAHFVIIDDPIDPQGARSDAELETAARFMTDVVPSRVVDKGVVPTVLVMQRIHPRDPSKVLLDAGKRKGATPVRLISLPGELTGGAGKVCPPLEELRLRYPKDELSHRATEVYHDDLLSPRRMSRRVLADFQAKLSRYAYSAQVQQNPEIPGGGRFRESYFANRVRAAPYQARRVRYWDRAATQDGGCYTAGVLLARCPEGNWYVEHVVHGQWEPQRRNQIIYETALRDRRRYGPRHTPTVYVEAERGSTGLESFQAVARKLAGFRVREDQPTGSKDTRSEPWADQLAAGNVYLVDGGESTGEGVAGWDVAGYVEEHLLFQPDLTSKRLGKFKDQVDASSGAFNAMTSARRGPLLRVVPIGMARKGELRLMVCARDELEEAPWGALEDPALLVSVFDPDESPEKPAHGLGRLLDWLPLSFADLDPSHLMDVWEQPMEPWGKRPEELVMQSRAAVLLWKFLLADRVPQASLVVFQGGDDGRAESLARAVCDVLRKPTSCIFFPTRPDNIGCGESPPNEYVYQVTKTGRHLVNA